MALNQPAPHAPWGEYALNTSLLTVDQFEQLPESEGWAFELHQGRVVRMPGPGGIHGQIQARLTGMLWVSLAPRQVAGLYSTACYYLALPGGDEVLCPDMSFIVPERVPSVAYRGSYLALTPDWVIEISSPHDYRPHMQRKMQVYLAAGIRLGWVIWPNSQTVDVWRPGDATLPSRIATPTDTLDGADIIPGLTMPVSQIFDF